MRTPTGIRVQNGMFVNAQGMTLYTWDNDREANKSACAGNCLTNWPALAAEANATNMGDWVIVTRDDGSKQWAYKGKPLYTYAQDRNPGDVVGDGRGGTWHIARP
jgi:predicted lipoprotein with Yx(FWY)xxD motif